MARCVLSARASTRDQGFPAPFVRLCCAFSIRALIRPSLFFLSLFFVEPVGTPVSILVRNSKHPVLACCLGSTHDSFFSRLCPPACLPVPSFVPAEVKQKGAQVAKRVGLGAILALAALIGAGYLFGKRSGKGGGAGGGSGEAAGRPTGVSVRFDDTIRHDTRPLSGQPSAPGRGHTSKEVHAYFWTAGGLPRTQGGGDSSRVNL